MSHVVVLAMKKHKTEIRSIWRQISGVKELLDMDKVIFIKVIGLSNAVPSSVETRRIL